MKLIVKLSLALALFASCTQNEIKTTDEIRLGVKSDAYSSRAVINDVAGLIEVGDKIGVYGVNVGNSSKAPSQNTKWGTYTIKNECTNGIGDNGEIRFVKGYTYPENESVRFFAYYPHAELGTQGANYLEEPTEMQASLLHFTTDGTTDVMYADPVEGSQANSGNKLLLFNHALTQLRFKLADPNGLLAGAKVKKITFTGVNTTSVLNIETGELGQWGNPFDITLDAKYPIAVAPSGVEVDGRAILQPGLPSFTLSIVTDAGVTYSNVKIKPDNTLTFEAGTSYEVTLKFMDRKEVYAIATVEPWIMAGYGEGIVQ